MTRTSTKLALTGVAGVVLTLGILLASAVNAPLPSPGTGWREPAAAHTAAAGSAPWGHDRLHVNVASAKQPAVGPGLPAIVKPLATQRPFVTPPEHTPAPVLPAAYAAAWPRNPHTPAR